MQKKIENQSPVLIIIASKSTFLITFSKKRKNIRHFLGQHAESSSAIFVMAKGEHLTALYWQVINKRKQTLQTIHQLKLKHSKILWNQIPLITIIASQHIRQNSHQLRRTSTITSTEIHKLNENQSPALLIKSSKSTFVIKSSERRLISKKINEKQFQKTF